MRALTLRLAHRPWYSLFPLARLAYGRHPSSSLQPGQYSVQKCSTPQRKQSSACTYMDALHVCGGCSTFESVGYPQGP